jgi:hypothetical protein
MRCIYALSMGQSDLIIEYKGISFNVIDVVVEFRVEGLFHIFEEDSPSYVTKLEGSVDGLGFENPQFAVTAIRIFSRNR